MILSKNEIDELMKLDPPLVEDMIDPDTQIQVNGCELTVDRIFCGCRHQHRRQQRHQHRCRRNRIRE